MTWKHENLSASKWKRECERLQFKQVGIRDVVNLTFPTRAEPCGDVLEPEK